MLKLNNKGFVLIETLVTAVFVMAIFSIIYANFYPIMAEYEKRESYDDLDSKYAVYWIKRIIQSNSVNFDANVTSDINNNKYHQFSCEEVNDATQKRLCENLIKEFQVNIDANGKPAIYVTNFKMGDLSTESKDNFKGAVDENKFNSFSSGFQDYVAYLPTYSGVISNNGACYRVVVEFHHTKDNNDYYTYSTIEVLKGSRCFQQ